MIRRRFEAPGLLALEPRALGATFPGARAPASPFDRLGDVAVVSIVGPLTHHDSGFFDSYDAVLERVEAAFQSKARTVVLKIDSPGGEYSGCLDAVGQIRDMAKDTGKKLVAYVDGTAASAGYAIACAAKRIVVALGARIGSVGVIGAVVDGSAADHAMGLRIDLLSSGARKSDGNPHVQLTPDARAALQGEIDAQGGLFFELVASARRLTPRVVAGWQAAMFTGGVDAVDKGLADAVLSFPELLASISTTATAPRAPASSTTTEPEGPTMRNYFSPQASRGTTRARPAPAPVRAPVKPHRSPKLDHDAKVAALAQLGAPALQAIVDQQAREIAELKEYFGKSRTRSTSAEQRGLPPDQQRELDRKMGLIQQSSAVVHDGNRMILGAPVDKRTGKPLVSSTRASKPPAEQAELDRKMGLGAKSTGPRNVGNKLILG